MNEQSVMQMLEAYKNAVFAKDVDGLVALYADDVQVFDMWGTWLYNGINAWRGMIADWFGSLGTERVVVEFDDVKITVSDTMAMIHAIVTYAGESADGERLRAMHNRMTLVLQPYHGAWKIVHEHTSSPIDFATGKVMLKRVV